MGRFHSTLSCLFRAQRSVYIVLQANQQSPELLLGHPGFCCPWVCFLVMSLWISMGGHDCQPPCSQNKCYKFVFHAWNFATSNDYTADSVDLLCPASISNNLQPLNLNIEKVGPLSPHIGHQVTAKGRNVLLNHIHMKVEWQLHYLFNTWIQK